MFVVIKNRNVLFVVHVDRNNVIKRAHELSLTGLYDGLMSRAEDKGKDNKYTC